MYRLLLVIAGIAGGARVAEAEMVMMEPPVPHLCRTAATWPAVEACLKKIGRPTVLRSLPDARLVVVADNGSFLYVHHSAGWVLEGELEPTTMIVTDLRAVTYNHHVGYRFDFGLQQRTQISLDDSGAATGVVRTRHVVLCGADQHSACVDAVVHCEAFVHGKSYFVFRGTLAVEDDDIVRTVGDRTRAGGPCTTPEKLFLGWRPDQR